MAAASAVYWSIVEKYYFYLLTYTPCYMWLLCRKVRLKRIKSVYVTDPGLSNGSDTFPPAKPPTLIIENAEKSSLINWFFWKVLIQEYGTRVNNDVIQLRWILNLNRPCIVIRLLFSAYVSVVKGRLFSFLSLPSISQMKLSGCDNILVIWIQLDR